MYVPVYASCSSLFLSVCVSLSLSFSLSLPSRVKQQLSTCQCYTSTLAGQAHGHGSAAPRRPACKFCFRRACPIRRRDATGCVFPPPPPPRKNSPDSRNHTIIPSPAGQAAGARPSLLARPGASAYVCPDEHTIARSRRHITFSELCTQAYGGQHGWLPSGILPATAHDSVVLALQLRLPLHLP